MEIYQCMDCKSISDSYESAHKNDFDEESHDYLGHICTYCGGSDKSIRLVVSI